MNHRSWPSAENLKTHYSLLKDVISLWDATILRELLRIEQRLTMRAATGSPLCPQPNVKLPQKALP